MKVQLSYVANGLSFNEVFSGHDSDEIVSAMKQRTARQAGFAARFIIQSMSPLAFAQEVVRRYNRHANRDVRIPATCEEFIQTAESEGILTMLDA